MTLRRSGFNLKKLLKKIKKSIIYFYHTAMRAHGKPREIALGMALGVFAGLLPYAISQTVLALFLAAIFRANKVSAAAGTWISNPFTSLPLYFTGYTMGAYILGEPLISYAIIKKDFTEVSSLKEAFGLLLGQMGMPILIGTAILGAILGMISYFITYQAVIAYRIRKNKKRLQRMHMWCWTEEEGWRRVER